MFSVGLLNLLNERFLRAANVNHILSLVSHDNPLAAELKQKNTYTIFLDSLSFCVKDPPPYLQRGGHKMTFILYIYLYIEKLEVP